MSGSEREASRRWRVPKCIFSHLGARSRPLGVLLILSLMAAVCHAEVVSLSKLDVRKIQQARGPRGFRGGRPSAPAPLSIAGQKFEDGVRTFGSSTLWIDLGQKARRFTALVGIDDEAKAATGTAIFRVYGDAKELFNSGPMKATEPARKAEVDVTGVKLLLLMVDTGETGRPAAPLRVGDVNRTDWADAKIEYEGTAPEAIDGPPEPSRP